MIIIVFLGTIYQGELGLYMTQKIYFSSWIYWFYFIPLPAGRLLLLVMTINLFALSLRKSLWKFKKIGILTVHLGALLLFVGGGITAYFSYEGRMTIKEGDSSDYIEDYYIKELAFINPLDQSITFQQDQLFKSNKLQYNNDNIDFDIKVLSFLTNSKPINRIENCSECRGPFQSYQLVGLNPQAEYEQNNTAVVYEISGISDSIDGVYASMVFEQKNNSINIDDKELSIILRPKRTQVPLEITLIDFKEVLHPGTDIAKSYSSEVTLNTDDLKRNVLISMNEPLRHHEYTFFQSAFNRSGQTESSTFAVVKNYGRLFPYISSIIMCIGLLLHLSMMTIYRVSKRR